MNPALTVLLMVQPSVLSGLMQNGTFRGRGLTARFLYCIPASFVGKRRYRSEPVPEEIYREYELCIRNLLEDECGKEAEIITLSDEADAMIEMFAERLEPELNRAMRTSWIGQESWWETFSALRHCCAGHPYAGAMTFWMSRSRL